MKTIVTKFGGTSLADAGQFKKVKAILEADPRRKIVVASAPGKRFSGDIKVTDLLLSCYEKAAEGDLFEGTLKEVQARFKGIIDELGVDFPLEDEIKMIREHLSTEPDRAYMASRGEYMNSRILAAYLGFAFVDPAWCVCFDEKGNLEAEMTKRAMCAALRPLDKAVVAGFYGADSNGKIHTFSRGGSDVTGSLAAKAVQADLYENWTDVSGLLAADPRIVEKPRSVEYLSYHELRTLSYMGASVLHTDAVLPASESGIPINIRNTNRPEDHGTLIVREFEDKSKRTPITGVAGRTGMSVIQVEKIMVSDGSGFSAILLDILKKRGVPFEQCITGIDTVTLVIKSELLKACKDELIAEIQEVLNPDHIGVKDDLSMIAVIGEGDTVACSAKLKVLQAVASAGIEISTINQGAGKLNLLIGVPEDRYQDAIKVIYSTIEE